MKGDFINKFKEVVLNIYIDRLETYVISLLQRFFVTAWTTDELTDLICHYIKKTIFNVWTIDNTEFFDVEDDIDLEKWQSEAEELESDEVFPFKLTVKDLLYDARCEFEDIDDDELGYLVNDVVLKFVKNHGM